MRASACAAAVFDDHVSLGVSTGGSIVCPASFCGVYGLAPSYGRVSRYGLIDYGNSLDKVGLLSFKASDLRRYLPIISGKDVHDPTSMVQPELDLGKRKMKSVAIPKQAMEGEGISKGVTVVFSEELPDRDAIIVSEERNKKSQAGTLSYLPASFGCACAQAAINLLLTPRLP